MKSTLRPDWVMVGYRHENGRYRILASTSLNKAELDYLARRYHFADTADMVANLHPQYDLRAILNNYIVAEGDSYPEALQALLSGWAPSEAAPLRPLGVRGNTAPGRGMIDADWDGSPQTRDPKLR